MSGEFDNIKTCNKPVRDPLPRVNTLRTDLLGEKGREHIRKVNEGFDKRLQALIERHHGFNPENS